MLILNHQSDLILVFIVVKSHCGRPLLLPKKEVCGDSKSHRGTLNIANPIVVGTLSVANPIVVSYLAISKSHCGMLSISKSHCSTLSISKSHHGKLIESRSLMHFKTALLQEYDNSLYYFPV